MNDFYRKKPAAPKGPDAPSFSQRDFPPALPALPMIRLDKVNVSLGGRAVFAGLSLSFFEGEHLALAGANGAGKSTLLRLLQGDLRPDQSHGLDAGRVFWAFDGRPDPSALCARRHVRSVSPGQQRNYVRQGWTLSGEEILLSGLDNAAMIYGEMSERDYRRAAELAGAAGASKIMDMTAREMSQGQLRLALILRALMSSPRLLLLDEPFDGLDNQAREDVSRCMALAAGRGCTIIASAHRIEDIPGFIGKVLFLHDGAPLAMTVGQLAGRLAGHDGFCRAAPPLELSGPRESLETTARGKAVFLRGDAAGAPLFELSHVDVFIERKPVLFDINWLVRKGEQWIISGPNGSGKSTLLRLLYGEEAAAYGGGIFWMGKPRPSLETLRSAVGYVSDRLQDLYDYDLSAEEVVISGAHGNIGLYREPAPGEREAARLWLRRMGLNKIINTPFHSLSSGLARRVLLARALAHSPPLLLLDEPCSGLDPQSRAIFLDALPALGARGVQIIHVSHHNEDKSLFFTHELRLEAGRVLFAGERK